jgi:spore coat protein U-like protein
MLKNFALRLLIVTAVLAAPAIALAAAAITSPIQVSASVAQTCSIATTKELVFGAYDPVGTNASTAATATATLSVACSKSSSTTLSIGLSDGLHATSGQRAMQGATATDKLNYDLFWPLAAGTCPGTTKWTNITPGLYLIPAPPSKDVRTYNVCGVIPPNQDVAVGTYNDTVTATINF